MKRRRFLPLLRLLPFFILVLLIVAPLPDAFLRPNENATTRILDRNGALLYELRSPSSGLRQPIPLSQVPPELIAALLSIEDRRFYEHGDVSLTGIARALWRGFSVP